MKRINLKQVFELRQEELNLRLRRARDLVHPTAAGDEGERGWTQALREFLPTRYEVARGRFIVDADGGVSEQQDIVIHDAQYAPTLLNLGDIHYVPIESVYAVLEAKPTLNKENVVAAAQKAASVRRLEVYPGEFAVVGGGTARHEKKPIIAGLVCHDSDWSPPFGGPFELAMQAQEEDEQLDLGCVVNGGAFSRYADQVATADPSDALIAFCMGLFHALQKVGNAVAIDPLMYGQGLWKPPDSQDLGIS
jgi:hypothetical protein